MLGGIGLQEIIIILLIVSLLFGAKKIPELAKGIGQALKEFRRAMKEEEQKNKTEEENKEESKEVQKDISKTSEKQG